LHRDGICHSECGTIQSPGFRGVPAETLEGIPGESSSAAEARATQAQERAILLLRHHGRFACTR
jgi:hypothetical protein